MWEHYKVFLLMKMKSLQKNITNNKDLGYLLFLV